MISFKSPNLPSSFNIPDVQFPRKGLRSSLKAHDSSDSNAGSNEGAPLSDSIHSNPNDAAVDHNLEGVSATTERGEKSNEPGSLSARVIPSPIIGEPGSTNPHMVEEHGESFVFLTRSGYRELIQRGGPESVMCSWYEFGGVSSTA